MLWLQTRVWTYFFIPDLAETKEYGDLPMNDFTENLEYKLFYQGHPIHCQEEFGLICLTDFWEAHCNPVKNKPLEWIRLGDTQTLLKKLAERTGATPIRSRYKSEKIISEIPGILETHIQSDKIYIYSTIELAVIYARSLSIECYEWALTSIVEESYTTDNLLEKTKQDVKLDKAKKHSRRHALIAAGWAVPVVTRIVLQNKAVAAGSPGSHVDTHSDSHGDSSHLDNHGDGVGHVDESLHSDGPAPGGGHNDRVLHTDTPSGHQDVHFDS